MTAVLCAYKSAPHGTNASVIMFPSKSVFNAVNNKHTRGRVHLDTISSLGGGRTRHHVSIRLSSSMTIGRNVIYKNRVSI